MLCSGCQKKLSGGGITKTDIAVSRLLAKLGIDANYVKIVEDEKSIIIITEKKDTSAFIGRGGKNTKQLTQMLKKEVRIIENGNKRQMIEKIVRSPIIGINVVYGNGEKYRIRMHRTRQRISTELISALLGKRVEVVFE
jgi:transcription antitermination factor NusA-like protein